MAIEIPSSLVEFILLGPTDDRRQLQDSPILGDVWVAFATRPEAYLDLLITPRMTLPAGQVADSIQERLDLLDLPERPKNAKDADIAYLQGIVAARLCFEELLRVVIPITQWWDDKRTTDEKGKPRHELLRYGPQSEDREKTRRAVQTALEDAKKQFARNASAAEIEKSERRYELMPLDRYVVLAGLILWARGQKTTATGTVLATTEKVEELLKNATPEAVTTGLDALFQKIVQDEQNVRSGPVAWQVSLNRTAAPALTKSIPAVKADAARFLFKVDCGAITWAVIDSGIDGNHPAFRDAKSGKLRIKRCFDFTNFRKIVSLSNSRPAIRRRNLEELLQLKGLRIEQPDVNQKEELDKYLETLAQDAKGRASIHWDLVEKFVEIEPTTKPETNHGTHVAGILGASKEAAEAAAKQSAPGVKNADIADGMCPDINLWDFRVLGPSMKDTEFAIIAVLQYIRHINDRDNYFSIHGVNLSLSIPHDVRNFACGSTPICTECERLSNSGVVVVAAAGNHGHKSFETKEGAFEGYAAFSITDPGNADGVITVGATHRNWPHTYGVSFFSSRGPTGDGRLKPDLVAPGERIRAPFPKGEWGDLDGTSMAAPHVSGAAAMRLARYSELIGQPRRVKCILCETATDLGRERTFQGHGMLDVLRAFQSI